MQLRFFFFFFSQKTTSNSTEWSGVLFVCNVVGLLGSIHLLTKHFTDRKKALKIKLNLGMCFVIEHAEVFFS